MVISADGLGGFSEVLIILPTILHIRLSSKFVNIESYSRANNKGGKMFGLEILFALGVAIISAALLSIFVAVVIGLIIAVKDTIDERKGKK